MKAENLGIIDKKHSSAKFSSELGAVWFGKRYCEIPKNPLTKTVLRYYLGKLNINYLLKKRKIKFYKIF